MTDPTLLTDLSGIVGPDHVLDDPDTMSGYTVDWTGAHRASAAAVVRPAHTTEVAAVIRRCREAGLPVTAQGGNTGLVAGGVPVEGGIVLSLRRLDGVGPVEGGQLTAGAGATLAGVQRAAAAAGWRYPVDLAARDSATVGGTIATNAGGVHVLRYGATRAHVVGVEAVTGTGSVVGDLRGLEKDNTGYHLPSLLSGSEGTLAVVCRARLRLVVPPEATATAMVPVASLAEAVELVAAARQRCADLEAAEFMARPGLELVAGRRRVPLPDAVGSGGSVIVEAAGPAAVEATLAAALGPWADVAVAAVDGRDRSRLWGWREDHTEAIASVGVARKHDVTLPAGALAGGVDAIVEAVEQTWPHARVWLFGHLGDGNMHVNITGIDPDDPAGEAVTARVFEIVADRGGSISAEHGIGRSKRDYLHLNRSADELALYRRLRRAFDPDGILNPGVLTDG